MQDNVNDPSAMSVNLGLRERQRRATRAQIERAAVETVERLGLTRATVREISQAAGVAIRTFFNHFPTKESALLGEEWRPISAAASEYFAASRDPIMGGLGRLLWSMIDLELLDRDMVRRRRRLAELHPALGGRRVARIAELEADLPPIIAERLAREYPDQPSELREQATLLLAAVAVAAFRSAWTWWTDHGDDGSLGDDIVRRFALLDIPRLGFDAW